MKKAVENYIKVGILGDLFESESQFELSEVSSDRLRIRVSSCLYEKSCEDVLQGGSKAEQINCPRIRCFRPAVLVSGNPWYYEVQKVDP